MTQLSARQERAVELLCAGLRESEAAERLGVNRSTLWRWRTENPAFQATLNLRRREVWEAATERLRNLVPVALDALAAELDGPHRLRAAGTVLELAGFRAARNSDIVVRPSGPTTTEGVEHGRAERAALNDLLTQR